MAEQMKQFKTYALVFGAALTATGTALAQSPEYMIEDCRHASQQFYLDYEATTEAKYEGQRTNGTHAVNGTIYLETRSADFSCSYNAAGDALVRFFAEKKSWPKFVRGEGSPYQSSASGGGSSNNSSSGQKVTNEIVRFLAGQNSQVIPVNLPARMTVRYKIGAKKNQFLDVSVTPANAPLNYRIVNPDGTALLDELSVDKPYRGQLWQSGDHYVEVINRNDSAVPFEIYFGIE